MSEEEKKIPDKIDYNPQDTAKLEDELDPLRPPVQEREYVKRNIGQTGSQSYDIPEDKIKPNPLGSAPSEDKTSSSSGSSGSGGEKKAEPKKEKLENPEAKDMSASQKRREAEKAANSLLFHYCLYVPMPFIAFASFNERKVEQLAMEDKIDLSMEFTIDRDYTVKEYIDGINKEVKKAFTISEERKNEIREPLIDLLLEQNLVLTPKQRLGLAIGSHVAEMIMNCYKIWVSNQRVMDWFVKAHAEEKQKAEDEKAREKAERAERERERTRHEPEPEHHGGASYHRAEPEDEHQEAEAEEETHESEEESTSSSSVTAHDESTGEEVHAEIIETKTKRGGRPKGTTKTNGVQRRKKKRNAVSMDEALETENASLKDEIKNEVLGEGESEETETE